MSPTALRILWTLLEDCKWKGIAVLDIKIDKGTLEQHFIDIAGRKDE